MSIKNEDEAIMLLVYICLSFVVGFVIGSAVLALLGFASGVGVAFEYFKLMRPLG